MGLFNSYMKPGKGVSKEDLDKHGLSLYLDILGRRFWSLMSLNLLYVVLSIPAIVIGYFVSAYLLTWIVQIIRLEFTADIATGLSLLSSVATVLLILFCGSGPANAGIVTVLRKHVEDSHSWGWSDFFYGFRKNFMQAILVYIINILLTSIFVVGFVYYSVIMKGLLSSILSMAVVVVGVIFFMMQMYTYQIMICVELRVRDIYRNAALLVLGKLPWNVLIGIVTAFLIVLVYEVFMSIPVVGVLLLIVFFYSFTIFTQVFMTNNIMKKYVLEPAYQQSSQENLGETEE